MLSKDAVDLAQGRRGRPQKRQLSTDGLAACDGAVERAFGAEVDYGQAVKFDEAEPVGPALQPPQVVDMERAAIAGNPDTAHISTSIIDCQNLTLRMSMRRFTRLTRGFSKTLENMKAAVSLHFALQLRAHAQDTGNGSWRRKECGAATGVGRADIQSACANGVRASIWTPAVTEHANQAGYRGGAQGAMMGL